MNLNKVYLIGRLTRDPEMRTIPSGQSVCNFGLATNRNWVDQSGVKQEATEFHNIVAWRKLAEICGQYLKKGGLVMIEGRLQTRSWQAQDGTNRYRTEIVAEGMQMGPRAAGQSAYSSPAAAASREAENSVNEGNPTPTIQLDDQGNPIDEVIENPGENLAEPGEPPSTIIPF